MTMRFLCKAVLILFTLIGVSTLSPRHVFAQNEPPAMECILPALETYLNGVLSELNATDGHYGHVYLLSPAWNMTSPYLEQFLSMDVPWNEYYAMAGNAYHVTGTGGIGTINQWVTRLRNASPNDRLLLTETGWYPPGQRDPSAVAAELAAYRDDPNMIAMLLFNAFGTNGDTNFTGHVMEHGEIATICGNSNACGAAKVGVNSAVYYSAGNGFYDRASSYGMTHTIEIANNDTNREFPNLINWLDYANSRGITPVLRIGVQDNSGGFDDPSTTEADPELLARFIHDLNELLEAPGRQYRVYVIAGPNEPETECWATPACGCQTIDDEDVPITFYGQVKSSLPTPNQLGELVSNRPIRGAALALYEGTVRFDLGNEYGLVYKYSDVATDGNGEYRITGVRRAGGQSHDNAMWMYIWCGPTLVDQWKLDLTEELRKKNFSVPCFSSDYPEPLRPPDIATIQTSRYSLTCEPEAVGAYQSNAYPDREIAPGFSIPIQLLKEDEDDSWVGNDINLDNYDPNVPGSSGLPPAPIYSPDYELSVRSDISDVSVTYPFAWRIFGSYVYGEATPQLDGQLPEDTLLSCEDIKFGNRITPARPDEDPLERNTHLAYSLGSTLSLAGMWEKWYDAIPDKSEVLVCTMEDGHIMRLCDIQSPLNFREGNSETCDGRAFESCIEDGTCLDSSYFPYLLLMNEFNDLPGITSNSHRGILDSYEESSILTIRDTEYPNTFIPTPDAKSYQDRSNTMLVPSPGDQSFNQITNECASRGCSDINPVLSRGAGAVLDVPFDEFGCENTDPDNPDSGCHVSSDVTPSAENVERVGTGDFQLRSFEACTCNVNDPTCSESFNSFTYYEDDTGEKHGWTDGARYLSPAHRLTIGPFDFTYLFGLSFSFLANFPNIEFELTNPEEWAVEYLPQDTFWGSIEGATELDIAYVDLDGDGDLEPILPADRRGECVPLTGNWVDVGYDCRNQSYFPCRGQCSMIGGPGSPFNCDALPGCEEVDFCGGEAPPEVCRANMVAGGYSYQCSFQIQNDYGNYGSSSACIGDIHAEYAATSISFDDARFNRSDEAAMMKVAMYLLDPYIPINKSGCGSAADHPNTAEDDFMKATSAANTTGPCGADFFDGIAKQFLADPVPFDDREEPEWVGQLPNMGAPGGNNGGNNGNFPPPAGNCELAPVGSACDVDILAGHFPTPEAAVIASMFCNRESNGSPLAYNHSCLSGGTRDYSIGLFQINLVEGASGAARCARVGHPGVFANEQPCYCNTSGVCHQDMCNTDDIDLPLGVPPNEPDAGIGPPPDCSPYPNLAALEACAAEYHDPATNLQYAVDAAGCDADGNCNWRPWLTGNLNVDCGVSCNESGCTWTGSDPGSE